MAFHPPSELILNPDGSVYHLKLLPEQIAPTIILVGDQARVDMVSKYFDRIDYKIQSREFKTHTGVFNHIPVSVVSTGIGTDNIDIVLNEIDALFNIDLKTREDKKEFTSVRFIRIGTSGALREELEVDSFLISAYGMGLGGLMHFYQINYNSVEKEMAVALEKYEAVQFPIRPYVVAASNELIAQFGEGIQQGITVTCPGFYAPQGRQLRGRVFQQDYLEGLRNFQHLDLSITNFEMETAGIYGLSSMLGHRAISFNALLANRASGHFSQQPGQTIEKLIELVMSRL